MVDSINQASIKVLHIIDSAGLYGAENVVINLIKQQKLQNLNPLLLSITEPRSPEKAIDVTFKNERLPLKSWEMQPGFNIVKAYKIIQWAKNEGFTILHSHGYKFNILFAVLKIFSLCDTPVISTLHGFSKPRWYKKMFLYEYLDRLSMKFLDGLVAVDKKSLGYASLGSHKHDFCRIISNGVDIEKVSAQKNEQIKHEIEHFFDEHIGHSIFVSVGRLSPEKGFDILLEAFARLQERVPNSCLIIFGEGSLRSELENMVSRLGLSECVLMPGYVSPIPAYLNKASCLVIASHTEGLPMVLLEAMLVSTPVVATKVGAIPKVMLENNHENKSGLNSVQAGCLVQPGDISGLCKAMLASIDSVFSEEMTRVAKQQVINNYSSEKMAADYLEFYKVVLKNGNVKFQTQG